jgi:hypothetical protein
METNLETDYDVIGKTAVISNNVLVISGGKMKFKIEFSKLVKICFWKLQIRINEGSLFLYYRRIILLLAHS